MKRKFMMSSWSRKAIGSMLTISAAALTITLAACDDSSSASNAGEPENEEISSDSNGGDGSNTIESSANVESSATVTSSETSGNSSNSNGNSATSQNGDSSNSQNGTSSASTSSNSVETCSHITDNECRISQGCVMTPCMDGTKALDCATNLDYVCKGGTWQVAESCTHLSDVEGSNKWTSTEPEFTITKDCSNGFYYMRVEGGWVKIEDCDPSK